MRVRHAAVLAGLILGMMSSAAQAAYTFSFTETPAGVLQTGSGSLDVDGLPSFGFFSTTIGMIPNGPAAIAGTVPLGGSVTADAYAASFDNYAPFGAGGFRAADSGTGSTVGFSANGSIFGAFIFVPTNYESGDSLGTSTALYAGKTFSDLGLTPGTHTYGYVSPFSLEALAVSSDVELPEIDSITVRVGTVPLPGSAPMFGAALLGLAGMGYVAKRKKAAVAA